MKRRSEQYQDYLARLFPEDKGRPCKTVTLQVTDACNLRCTYCYQVNKGVHRMDWDTAKRAVDLLLDGNGYIDAENAGGIVLDFIGGEPLLEIDLIDRITDYFIGELIRRDHPWKTKFRISICSNGVLYFDERVQRYLKKNMGNVSFTITVDGNKRLHDSCRVFPDGSGSYDLAMAAVKHYTEVLGGYMGSKVTLCPENVRYTHEAIAALIDAGYREIYANCVFEKGWTPEHARILYKQLVELADDILARGVEEDIYVSIFEGEMLGRPIPERENRNWCGGTGEMLAIDWKGDCYPCLRYMESSLGNDREPMIIGNIRSGLMATPGQRECVRCLQCITRRSQSTDECFTCPIAQGCAWCSAYNYQVFGTPDRRATFICEMHKARVLANVYYWNRVYLRHGEKKVFENHVPDEWALPIVGEAGLNQLKDLERRAKECLQ